MTLTQRDRMAAGRDSRRRRGPLVWGAAALAAADPGALAALDPRDDQELFVAGRAAWQVLAGAASAGAFTADLRYAAAPFEVSYYVTTWMRAH